MWASLLAWIASATALGPILKFLREHKVPAQLTGRAGWMYVFGLSTMMMLVLQVITGLALTTAYVPSPQSAYQSLLAITNESRWGALTRALHYYGASAMVVLMSIHMARVYLTASYKHPRQVGWISGVFLFGLVMAMAVTGQLLRWDETGVWTVVVAAKFMARVPLIGPWLGEFVLAGPTLSGATLTRFYSLHVLLVPLIILGFLVVHLYLLVYNGVSEPPREGQPVDRRTYRARYQRLKEAGARYFPDVAWREFVIAGVAFAAVFVLALVLGPKGPGNTPDPTRVASDPRPDWFVRWYYALLWFKPRGLETLVMVYMPLLIFLIMVVLPLISPTGERSLRRRPWALGIVALSVVTLGGLTLVGLNPPWALPMDTQPLTARELGPVPRPVVEGARIFYERGCQYCHVVLDRGGRYGPELTYVTRRMSPQEVAVWTIVGGGNMPSYRDTIEGAELDTILTFLRALPEVRRRDIAEDGR